MNWQVANGLSYFAKAAPSACPTRALPDRAAVRAGARRGQPAPIGREVALTERARSEIDAAYGPLLPIDTRPAGRRAAAVRTQSPRSSGRHAATSCASCKPSRDLTLDAETSPRASRGLAATVAFRCRRLRRHRGLAGAHPISYSDQTFRSRHGPTRWRWVSSPDGVVAVGRHDPPDGIRPRRRRTPPHADRRAGCQLRGTSIARDARSRTATPRISSPRSRATSSIR